MAHISKDKEKLLSRVRRIRGQVEAIERTLREDEVAEWSAQIVKALESLGGSQRT